MNTSIGHLRVKLFADGADRASMLEMYENPLISGLTTNPSLMKKAGVTDYAAFCKDILSLMPDKPLSFEVFSDEFDEMARQARVIAGWGPNVYVKVPITNTRGESSIPLIEALVGDGIKVNVTALMTLKQVRDVVDVLDPAIASYVSIFAGRIADTGRPTLPLMAAAVELLRACPSAELIWASPRELYNIFEADMSGCHIITATPDVLRKLSLLGKDLTEYSLETVQMFYRDAVSAGYSL